MQVNLSRKSEYISLRHTEFYQAIMSLFKSETRAIRKKVQRLGTNLVESRTLWKFNAREGQYSVCRAVGSTRNKSYFEPFGGVSSLKVSKRNKREREKKKKERKKELSYGYVTQI